MSEQEIRNHLKNALASIVEAEHKRVSKILNNSKIEIAEGIEKMEPIIALISALKEEVGDIEGLEISSAEHGHMAIICAQTSVTRESLSISTNYENNAFVIEESISHSIDNSFYENRIEYSAAEDLMARVLDVVGKHIGGQQAQQANKNTNHRS